METLWQAILLRIGWAIGEILFALLVLALIFGGTYLWFAFEVWRIQRRPPAGRKITAGPVSGEGN